MTLHTFPSLPSTNQYCELLDLREVEEFAVYQALEQTAGIGQQGNCWASAAGQNLTFSLILKPAFLPFADQFLLTMAVSLGIADCLSALLPAESIRIKWPNDLYASGRKICGILTSNRIHGNRIASSIVGIGLNVNQTDFPSWVPNPVSVCQLTGRTADLPSLLEHTVGSIESRYRQLAHGSTAALEDDYLDRLLNLGTETRYCYRGAEVLATITGVNRFGHLTLVTSDGRHLSCQMKEIALLP